MTEEQFQTLTTDKKVVPVYPEFIGKSKVYFIRSIDRREGIIETTQKQSDGSNTYYRYENLKLINKESPTGKLLVKGDNVRIIANSSLHGLEIGSCHILGDIYKRILLGDVEMIVFRINNVYVYERDLAFVEDIKQEEKIDDYEILL